MKRIVFMVLMLCSCAGHNVSLRDDNDLWKPTENKDRYFTHGIKLTDETQDASYSLGQNFYTPGHKQETDLQTKDRPYAGYLYGEYRPRNVLDKSGWSFQGGLVGDHAYGEETQKLVHTLLGQTYPKGWDNQLHDEPTIMGTYETQKKLFAEPYFDVYRTLGANVGTPFTQGYGEITFRLGYGLDTSESDGPIFPRGPVDDASSKLSTYVFSTLLGRGVLWNTFLDGNLFQDSASIDKHPVVGEGRLGIAVEYSNWIAQYTYMIQTSEFEGSSPNDFGEIMLGRKL